MSQHRFFLVQESLPAAHIDSLLGRIVSSKTSPLDDFAPFPSPGIPPHNTNDIIPSILPVPNISAPFTHVTTHTQQQGIGNQLAACLKAELRYQEDQYLELECDELRRYMLPNPSVVFRDLMMNEHYAADVRSFLEKSWPRHAYLITGFLVAVNARRKTGLARENKCEANVTVSLGEIAGGGVVPVLGPLDVGAGVGVRSATKQDRETTAAGEEIIAVSYSIAKLSYDTSWIAPFIFKTPAIGRAVRGKPNHKSMGDEDSEISDWDSGDEDTSAQGMRQEGNASHRPPTGIILEDDLEASSDTYVSTE